MGGRARDRLPVAARQATRLHDDPRAAAEAAGLAYVSDADPGLTRRRRGQGFSYDDARGRPVSGRRRQRIEALAIPPAWTDVWICARADGHLQATGVDDRGRKQYLYHEQWRALRDAATFDRLVVLARALPQVRAAVAAQLRRRTLDEERVLAGMVRILDLTAIRVGNEAYERANGTAGLATLRWRHVTLGRSVARVRFDAKSGRPADLEIRDAPVLRLLRQIQGPARRRIFMLDGREIGPDALNRYLAAVSGTHLTAKDFRTWQGTACALEHLLSLPAGEAPSSRHALDAVDAAASALRNTRAVARAHYVDPRVIECYLSGSLPTLVRRAARRGAGEHCEGFGREVAEQALADLVAHFYAGTPASGAMDSAASPPRGTVPAPTGAGTSPEQ